MLLQLELWLKTARQPACKLMLEKVKDVKPPLLMRLQNWSERPTVSRPCEQLVSPKVWMVTVLAARAGARAARKGRIWRVG
jgi:hypothetical protein